MASENNYFEENEEVSQFLEKFKEHSVAAEFERAFYDAPRQTTSSSLPQEKPHRGHSFEKLEQKIQELEQKFEASSLQNQQILSELAHTRQAMGQQQDRDAFLQHISGAIASLKSSVENLSRSQQRDPFTANEIISEPVFESIPASFGAPCPSYSAIGTLRQEQLYRQHEQEKQRAFSSLRQKASQLKAVNSALDREIKKVQQEKMEALKKSAEQAKEILLLREQLTAAEEKFKSFDFDNRIISIKQAYQQKVSSLEMQLKEMSDTCMQQVEQIESLKAENLALTRAVQEKEVLQQRLTKTDEQMDALKQEIVTLQSSSAKAAQEQLSVFHEQLRALEAQRSGISVELEQAQTSLESVRQEKEILEKNFQELVTKINGNDKIIAQLKQKIEVLGQQNETLAHNNKTLEERNAILAKRTGDLMGQSEQLNEETLRLRQQHENTETERKNLAQYVAKLNQEKHALEAINESISQENQQLRSQSAALLTAQLMHEKEQKDLAKAQSKIARKPQVPAEPILRRPSAPKTRKKVAFSSSRTPFASLAAQLSDSLPEIKVTRTLPQTPSAEETDFLTRTDSFLGRMKWSIFGEDK